MKDDEEIEWVDIPGWGREMHIRKKPKPPSEKPEIPEWKIERRETGRPGDKFVLDPSKKWRYTICRECDINDECYQDCHGIGSIGVIAVLRKQHPEWTRR